MMAIKYSKIPVGSIFEARGGKYRKVDELYYEDIVSGFQSVWSPTFDDTIKGVAAEPKKNSKDVNTTDKFLTDAQTRVQRPNPDYKEITGKQSEAEKVFSEMWGTASFDCGPEDFSYMALRSIKAISLVDNITAILSSVEARPIKENDIVPVLNRWADKMFNEPVKKPKRGVKKGK